MGLVEILVAMVLFLVLLNGLLNVFLQTRRTHATADEIIQLQQSGRAAVDVISSSLRRAGYLGDNSDIDSIWGSKPPVAPATTCPTGDDTWLRMVAQDVYGLNDADTGYDCIDTAYSRGDVVTLRYASPWAVDAADMDNTRLYLRSSLFEGKIFLGSEKAEAANTVLDNPQAQHQLLAYTYFVSDTGRTCNGAAIPGLFRVAADVNNNPVVEELVAGVENIQFQYQSGGRYLNADQVADWEAVDAVKMWILVRSDCTDSSYTDNRTYLMGDLAAYAPADNYKRRLYTTVVAMRNVW